MDGDQTRYQGLGLPEIDHDEIEFNELIGEGSYGKVYSGRCRGKQVAVKVFKRNLMNEKELQAFRDEVAVMSKIFHPNVSLFMGACTDRGKELMIVSEKMPTDLETLLIREQTKLPLLAKMQMAKDAALGMNWLHCSNPVFIHRDLKLSNLLVDDSYKVYVCDFGLTQMKPRDMESLEYDPHGSPLYMAPEVFFGDFNESCDVYSLGIVLWEMLTQKQAFTELGDDLANFIDHVCKRDYRPQIPEDTPESLSKLMRSCWSRTPETRPSFKQVIEAIDAIIVEIAIADKGGQRLWKSNFLGKEEVKWDVFVDTFMRSVGCSFGPTDIRLKCLKAVIASDSKGIIDKQPTVTMEQIGKVLHWFGPLFDPKQRSALPFLDRIGDMLKEPWFHGNIATSESEDRLTGQHRGTFLIRFSSRAPGCFTISHITKDKKILHQRVLYEPESTNFIFWNKSYADIPSLIKAEKKKFGFSDACPGSNYLKLFGTKEKDSKLVIQRNAYVIPGMDEVKSFK